MKRLSTTRTRSAATRASSCTPAAMSAKWCTAARLATTSKLESAKGRCSAKAWTSACMPGRRVDGDDLEARLAQPAGDMAAAGADVERRARAAGPFDQQIEVGALAVRLAVPVGVRPVVPDVRAHLSDTTFSAADSIVSST